MYDSTETGWIVRKAKNEALFREINERLQGLNTDYGTNEWLCECADIECVSPIAMTDEAYEGVRAHGARFVLLSGHELSRIEHVVETHDGYVVVEKTGISGELAALRNPRV
jgi:hypothetical protein